MAFISGWSLLRSHHVTSEPVVVIGWRWSLPSVTFDLSVCCNHMTTIPHAGHMIATKPSPWQLGNSTHWWGHDTWLKASRKQRKTIKLWSEMFVWIKLIFKIYIFYTHVCAERTLQLFICRQMPSDFWRISSISSFIESSLMCWNKKTTVVYFSGLFQHSALFWCFPPVGHVRSHTDVYISAVYTVYIVHSIYCVLYTLYILYIKYTICTILFVTSAGPVSTDVCSLSAAAAD